LGSIMMAGLMIGSLVGGKLSDRFGRKRTILWSIIVVVPATMFGGYSPNYATYIALRLLSCTALPCIWVANHSLTMEAFGHTHRKKVIIVKDYFWPVTQMILTLVVYYVRHWTNMHIWVGVICCAAFPSLFVLPESPRWLASNKRKEEVLRVHDINLSSLSWN
jgi:MFS family permease